MTGSLWDRGADGEGHKGTGRGGTREMRFYSNFLLIMKSFVFSVNMADSTLPSVGSLLRKTFMKRSVHENWENKYQFYIVC